MRLNEIIISTIIGGGASITAKAAVDMAPALLPSAGKAAVRIGTTVAALGTVGGAAYGAHEVGKWSTRGSVVDERDEVKPDVGPNGWIVAGTVATGLAAIGTGMASAGGPSGPGRVVSAIAAAALGAATIGSIVGMVRGNGQAAQDVEAWREEHPDEIKAPPSAFDEAGVPHASVSTAVDAELGSDENTQAAMDAIRGTSRTASSTASIVHSIGTNLDDASVLDVLGAAVASNRSAGDIGRMMTSIDTAFGGDDVEADAMLEALRSEASADQVVDLANGIDTMYSDDALALKEFKDTL